MESILSTIDSFIWGPPLLILLSGTGLYLTLRLGFIQIRHLPRAFVYMFKRESSNGQAGDVSAFAALCTALSATIGTGNIVGVATAVKAGGPGAIFWMWLVALLGMATKYAESLLAVKYRVRDKNGFMAGGPMYYIERGLGIKWLAKLFAVFGILVAFFGIGTFPQINAITHAMQDSFNVPIELTVIVMTTIVALIILGGVKRIASVSTFIVPFMAILYVATSVIILILNADNTYQYNTVYFKNSKEHAFTDKGKFTWDQNKSNVIRLEQDSGNLAFQVTDGYAEICDTSGNVVKNSQLNYKLLKVTK